METIDDETSAAAIDFIERQAKAGKPFFCGSTRPACTSTRMCGRESRGPERHQRICRRHDRARRPRRQAAQGARRPRHRRQHHRRLHHRQRPAHELLAGRRHDAVPQREEHQLGRRLPRAGDDPLAGPHQAGSGLERDRLRRSTGSRRCSRRPATPTSRRSCSRAGSAGGKTFKVHLDGYNQLPYLTGPAGEVGAQGVLLLQRRRPARRRPLRELEDRVLRAAGRRARCGSGPSRSSACACRRCSTCAWTPTSAPTSRRTPIRTG